MSGLPKFKPYLEKLGHSYDPTNSENSVSGTDQYTTLRLAVERYPWTAELYHERKAAPGCLRHSLETNDNPISPASYWTTCAEIFGIRY